jgi:hypothetical protein
LELHDVGWDSERAWATVILTGAGARQLNRQLGTRAFTAGGALGRIEFERTGSVSADKLGGRVP